MDALPRLYEFGDFRVDAHVRVLSERSGAPVRLTPKAFDTLLYLLEHRDGFSTKDALIRALWPDRVVEENNLDQNISALRRALGERRDAHRYIVTVPGKGYRLVADVTIAAATHGPELAAPVRSLAVLPFRPLASDLRDTPLELGMADTLIARLTGLREITVRPLGAVRKYLGVDRSPSEIGRELAVAAVLEGHLQRWKDTIRVSVSLVRVADSATLWAAAFDEKFDDIFTLQDSIAEHVADALRLELDSSEKSRLRRHDTESTAAYASYLKGRYFWWKTAPDEFAKSRDHFHQAVDDDPAYALGYCGLNSYYGFSAAWGLLPPDDAWGKAETAISKALVLDDLSAEAHTGLAALKLVRYRDWAGAERAARRAIALNPRFDEAHYVYSFYLLVAGRFEEAIAEARRALAIDPFSPRINEFLGKCLYFAGRYDESIRQLRHTLEFDADNAVAHESLGDALERDRQPAEAVAAWRRAMALAGDDALASCLTDGFARGGITEATRAVAELRLARLDAAAQAGRFLPAAAFAREYARAGEAAKARASLERALDEPNVFALMIEIDPLYGGLRDSRAFAAASRG